MRQPGTETNPLIHEDILLAYLSTVVEYVTSCSHESAQDLEIRGFSFGSRAKRAFNYELKKDYVCRSGHPERSHGTSSKHETCTGLQIYSIGCLILVRNYPSDRRCKDGMCGYKNQSVHIHAHEYRPSESIVGLSPNRVRWGQEACW